MSTPQIARATSPLPRGLIILLGAATAVVVIAGLQAASDIIGPVFLAVVVTIAVHPVHGFARRWGWPACTGTLLGILLSLVIVLGLVAVLVLAIARFADLLPQYKAELDDAVKAGVAWLENLGVEQSQIDDVRGALDADKLADLASAVLASVLGLASSLFFIVPLLLFLGVDATHLPAKLNEARADRGSMVGALESFALGTRRYLLVSTMFGFGVAVVDMLFLLFTPIPAPWLWGLLAFITNYIPNIGFAIGVIPPAVLGLLVGGPELMVLVVVVYSVLNIAIQSLIQPKVVGDAVGLATSITFVSLIFWAWVLGVVGALFAVPLTLFVKALLVDVDRDSSWLRPMLAAGPVAVVPSPAVTKGAQAAGQDGSLRA